MPEETRYLVTISATTAILAVVGKANYLNCHAVSDFFAKAIERGCTKIIVECSRCNGMDSTFLGMIAGAALTLRKSEGKLILTNLNERNLELVDNLGLNKIAFVESADNTQNVQSSTSLEKQNASHADILKAHENLIEADSANKIKFEDVIAFLKKENKA